MTPAMERELDSAGFTVLPDFMSGEMLRRLRDRVDQLFAEEGEKAGSEFRLEPGAKRLANLVDKGDMFQHTVTNRTILRCVEHVLGKGFKLSSLNVRSANPQSSVAQPLHTDNGAIEDDQGYWVCNTVWMLDDFTLHNGALRVVPGSHKFRKLPQIVLADPQAPHPDEMLVTGKAGTVVVMNSHTWHGGTANRTDRERRAIHGFFCRYDKAQQQYQKKLLRPETQASLSPQLRKLLALDDPLNDELCAIGSNQSGFLK